MNGGNLLEQIHIELRDHRTHSLWPVWIDVADSSLSRKWLAALIDVIDRGSHIEKNYCFMGFADGQRDGAYILQQVNQSIQAINQADLGYQIYDHFDILNCITDCPDPDRPVGRNIIKEHFNQLHRYFEDLQGVSGSMPVYYQRADAATRWHIRQLNLLCHEFECWALSWRKQIEAPEWTRPSMLMCWLCAPRFELGPEDYDLFGIDTISRATGGVYVGVNKAVGKHHWEVFNDEGRDSRLDELTTTTMRSQTEAAADFDIEWGQDPSGYHWQQQKLDEFRQWLTDNGFDPEDPNLTVGHPQVGQVDLVRSFGTSDCARIWQTLESHMDVYSISVDGHRAVYDYHWSDSDYMQQQIKIIQGDQS